MALFFTSANSDQISLPNLSKLDVTTQLSLSAWVNVAIAPGSGSQRTIISNGLAGGGRNFDLDYRNIGGTLQLELSCSVGASFGELRAVQTLTIGTWYNIVFTVDWTQVPWVQTCYVNGTSVVVTNSGGVTSGTPNASNTNRFIAENSGTKWNGALADVAVWKGVLLTQLEATGLARGRRPPSVRGSSLIGYWPIDGFLSLEADLSGSQMNGTPSGAPAPTWVLGPPFVPLTRRWPQVFTPGAPAAASSIVFRKASTPLGTRTGSRQMMDGLS